MQVRSGATAASGAFILPVVEVRYMSGRLTMRVPRVLAVGGWLGLWACSSAYAANSDLRLVTAVAEQDKEAARALVKQGIDVNLTRADGATALLYAAHWNDVETATV